MKMITERTEAERRLKALMEALPKSQAADDHTRAIRDEETIFDFVVDSDARHDAIEELRIVAAIAETAAAYREFLIGLAVKDGTPDRTIATAAQRSHSVIVRRRMQLGEARKTGTAPAQDDQSESV